MQIKLANTTWHGIIFVGVVGAMPMAGVPFGEFIIVCRFITILIWMDGWMDGYYLDHV